MTEHAENGIRRWNPWRIAGWSIAALVLMVPLIAMQFTDEVNWSVRDFIFAAVLILGVGIPFELAVRKTGNAMHRWAIGLALAATFLLLWVNGAVGIIGSEDNDANLLYGGVLAVGFVGALLARFRPRGMARAMFATALAQTAVTVGALIAGFGASGSGFEIVFINGFFVALWAVSAVLFQAAAHSLEGAAGTE